MATASPSWMDEEVSLRQWMPEWIPWPKEMLFASLFNSPLTVSWPASAARIGKAKAHRWLAPLDWG